MKSLLYHLKLVPIVTLAWVVFEEELSIRSVLVGASVGLVTLLLVDRYVLRGDYRHLYSIGVVPALRYVWTLIVQIYLAGFEAIAKLLTGRLNVDIVDITTSLDDDFRIALLANSITLTPGTVTLDRSGNRLRIIWLDCVTHDPEEAGRLIKQDFERLLSGGGS